MENVVLAAAIGALVLAERLPRFRFERARVLRPFFATDLFYLSTGGIALGLAMRRFGGALTDAVGVAVPALRSLPEAVLLVPALVLYDLGAYASHFWLHRSPIGWRFHKVHHSSLKLDWLATFRAHVVEHALRHLASTVLLLWLGFPPWVVAAATVAHTGYAAFGHANLGIDLRFLEPILITPRLHRLHHVGTTGSRNLGTFLSLWDRLRSNLLDDPGAPCAPLGVSGEEQRYPQRWLAQLVEPLRRAHGDPAPAVTSGER